MHPRLSVSAISTFTWTLDEDLAFWADASITNVGVYLAKLERAGVREGTARVVDAGLRVTNLLGLGFSLTRRDDWPAHQDRLVAAVDAAAAMGAECFVLTTGSAGGLTWEEAAEALESAMAPVMAAARERSVPFFLEHTHSLRVDVSFVHTLRDALDLPRRLGAGVLMEINA